ncbi:DUF5655 domain-containing protein [Streptococcus uberis]|uniref:DUF5655 domain-containing protein n=1 Tax=Streptococcus uberis TaxID=1349 RepID=UPI003D6B48E3
MSDYKQLFGNKEEEVLAIFSTLLDFLHDLGPFDIEEWLDLNIVSNQAIDHPLITKNEQVSKNRWHNNLRLSSVEEVDDTVKNLLQAAYLR